MAIKLLKQKFSDLETIVIVPSELLFNQWKDHIVQQELSNTKVYIINTAIKLDLTCDFLICDEIHRFAADSFSKIFQVCKYKYILGLTATLERLDGKHMIIENYCPVCDIVTPTEAIAQDWLAVNTEYKIVLHPDDITKYYEFDKEFQIHFEFFGRNFPFAMSMVGPSGYRARMKYRDFLVQSQPSINPNECYKLITWHATMLMKYMQLRKKYINEHPKKIELTREIINHRPNSKIITFSATTSVAEAIGIGDVYTGQSSKKKSRTTIDEFSKLSSGVLNTVKKANEGADIPGLNCAIILGQDSSKTTFTQRLGRCIRKEGEKTAEIFTFVIADTIEESWFAKSHENQSFIPIDEANLLNVLEGNPYEIYTAPAKQYLFRF